MALTEIPVSSIKLMDVIHKRGNPKYEYKHKPNADCWVKVRQTKTGYTLVSRWADYMECLNEGYVRVGAEIVEDGVVQRFGVKYLPFEAVKVPEFMQHTQPSEWKIQRARDRYATKKRLDKPLTLNADNYVIDGYTRYIVAQEVGMAYVPVIYCR